MSPRVRKYEPGLRYRRYNLVDSFRAPAELVVSKAPADPKLVSRSIMHKGKLLTRIHQEGWVHRTGWPHGVVPINLQTEAAAQANADPNVRTYEEFCAMFRESMEAAEARAIIEHGL